jgi:hypothetical protein
VDAATGVVVDFPRWKRTTASLPFHVLLVDAMPARTRVIPDTPEAKRSALTILGSAAAGLLVLAAGGAFSGIASVPGLVSEVAKLSVQVTEGTRERTLLERELTRLSTEAASEGRQVQAAQQRIEAVAAMLERVQSEQRAADLQAQKGLVEIEGRSANRNTEVKGLVSELRSEIQSLAARQADLARQIQDGTGDRGGRGTNRPGQGPQPGSWSIPQSESPPGEIPEFGHLGEASLPVR